MTKHNHASNWRGKKVSPTYKTWTAMVQRCCNPNHEHHSAYQGMFPDRWKDFGNFIKDMGERPEGTSIDRIDNTKGYYKENCRWATPKEQVRNRKKSLPTEKAFEVVELKVKKVPLKEIAEKTGLTLSRVKNILYRGDYIDEAFRTARCAS